MKWMLCLFVIMLLATMPAAAAEISGATASQILAELQKMNGELAALKADMAEVKADVAELKVDMAVVKAELAIMKAELAVMKADIKELQDEVGELKVGVAGTQGDVRGNIKITADLQSRMTSQTNALFLIAGLLVTILLWMLKKQWDERRVDSGKMDAQEKEIATQQAEIIALRAENERMKNAGGLVSSTGGRLESE